mmetsp:Transcript_25198/g.27503  ORF Transcript_25198/g.27503 Transcript_25198/m.27503 type:complete len:207 (+) Transcript_25198:43-663(+)|eukprot:gene571-611_t
MTNQAEEWKELKSVLKEVEAIFTENDLKEIIEINHLQQQYQTLAKNRIKDAKEIIKEMSATISKKEQEIVAPTNAQHVAAIKKLSEKENYSNQIQDLTQIIEMKKLQINKIQAMNGSLQDRTKEYTVGNTMVDSRTAYALSLYSKISNLSFDYQESNLTEGKLVGYAGNENKKELKKFELNLNEMSDFSVANRLWEIIEENCSTVL